MKDIPSYYATIPADVRYDVTLCPNAKLLYGELTALCSKKGYCWSSNNYFAKLYNVHKNTISKWISLLEKKRYIKTITIKIDKGYERNIYINQKAPTPKPKDVSPLNPKVDTPKSKDEGGIKKKIDTPKSNAEYNSTSNNTNNKTYNTIKHFNIVWEDYPRKLGKEKAFNKFQKQIKTKEDYNNILKAVKNYSDYIVERETPDEYIKHGSTWFNSDWRDFIEPYKPNGGTYVQKNSFNQNSGIEKIPAKTKYTSTKYKDLLKVPRDRQDNFKGKRIK